MLFKLFIQCAPKLAIAVISAIVCFRLYNARIQLSDNGVVVIGAPFKSARGSARPFPVAELLIAPYWDDIFMEDQGQLLYKVLSNGTVLDQISNFVAAHVTDFEASWALVARWEDVCLYGDSDCLNNQIGVSERRAHFVCKLLI